jgi:hypothetical protein
VKLGLLPLPRSDWPTSEEYDMSSNRHVVPSPDGGWDVKAPGDERASSHHDTQAEAIDRAREVVHNAGGGEVVTHGPDGRIRDSDTIAPGTTPSRRATQSSRSPHGPK